MVNKNILMFVLVVGLVIGCVGSVNAEILYQTGWEYGGIGASEVAVEDQGNPYGDMNEIGNDEQNGDAIVVTDSPFAGSNSLRIDWEDGASAEWYVQTPNVMSGHHEYYIGFAIRLDDGNVAGGQGNQWDHDNGERGRKLLYRVGGDQHSLLFHGLKGRAYCPDVTDSIHGLLWVKNKANTVDDDLNQPRGEKNYPGGPKCSTYADYQCLPWPDSIDYDDGNGTLNSDGEWHTIIVYVKEDTIDGKFTIWLDGNKILNMDQNTWDNEYTSQLSNGPCPVNYFDNHEADFSAFKFPTYYNSGPPAGNPQSEWWDNFIIATIYDEVEEFLNTSSPDTTPPTSSSPSPTTNLSSGTTQTTISLETDENADCKYSETSGTSYSSIPNTFSTTGGITHSELVTGLSDGNIYNFYVRCNDTSGNFNTDDFLISFSVDEVSSTCGPADTDTDGVVSITEIMAYITDWKAGTVDILDLMTGIGEWKNGCS